MGSMSWPFPRADAGQSFTSGDVNEIVFVNASGDLVSGAGAETDGSTYISVGPTPAAVGNGLRLTNDYSLFWRAVGGSDLRILILGNSDEVVLGAGGVSSVTLAADSRTLVYDADSLQFANPAATTRISVANEAGAAVSLQFRAGGSTASDTAGSPLIGQGGRRTGTGNMGGFGFELNDDDSTFHRILEGVHLANARRIVAINRGTALSTTEMPVNTGDLVMYIGNAAAAPTANSVSGGILYCEAGALKFRGTGGTVTTIAPA